MKVDYFKYVRGHRVKKKIKVLCACGCGEYVEKYPWLQIRFLPGHYARVQVQKGKSKIEFYGRKKAIEMNEKSSKKQKGISWEQRYGKKLSSIRKINMIKKLKGKKHKDETKKKISEKNKGKKVSDETRKKLSNSGKLYFRNENNKEEFLQRIEKNKIYTKEILIQNYKKLPNIYKKDVDNYRGLLDKSAIIREFKSFDNFAKICNKSFLKIDTRVFGHNGRIGKNETQILDYIEKKYNLKMIRQFLLITEKGRIWLDGYDKENNINYEVDEIGHKYTKIEDNIRDFIVKKKLNCKIVRINEKNILNEMNNKVLNTEMIYNFDKR